MQLDRQARMMGTSMFWTSTKIRKTQTQGLQTQELKSARIATSIIAHTAMSHPTFTPASPGVGGGVGHEQVGYSGGVEFLHLSIPGFAIPGLMRL
jgi:hypothetical protein